MPLAPQSTITFSEFGISYLPLSSLKKMQKIATYGGKGPSEPPISPKLRIHAILVNPGESRIDMSPCAVAAEGILGRGGKENKGVRHRKALPPKVS